MTLQAWWLLIFTEPFCRGNVTRVRAFVNILNLLSLARKCVQDLLQYLSTIPLKLWGRWIRKRINKIYAKILITIERTSLIDLTHLVRGMLEEVRAKGVSHQPLLNIKTPWCQNMIILFKIYHHQIIFKKRCRA